MQSSACSSGRRTGGQYTPVGGNVARASAKCALPEEGKSTSTHPVKRAPVCIPTPANTYHPVAVATGTAPVSGFGSGRCRNQTSAVQRADTKASVRKRRGKAASKKGADARHSTRNSAQARAAFAGCVLYLLSSLLEAFYLLSKVLPDGRAAGAAVTRYASCFPVRRFAVPSIFRTRGVLLFD